MDKCTFFFSGHCDSSTALLGTPSAGETPVLSGSHEALEAEIRRLRARLRTVEAENATICAKFDRQQWTLDTRLADIEMQICAAVSRGAASGVLSSMTGAVMSSGIRDEDVEDEEEDDDEAAEGDGTSGDEEDNEERNRESII